MHEYSLEVGVLLRPLWLYEAGCSHSGGAVLSYLLVIYKAYKKPGWLLIR